ncbi:hypothetical protein EX30DRAFT_395616 [Ascodesmis nigricans]|uniref:SH3b domain-containing protein n=1 Tax=Ascodesmis nigricans TaxID=341454 RepID=A0A4S2MY33_9PEZI|nr:hypothetical protein EX30DRAFT_395616 [Ascodesmis nigricans]
MKLHLIPLSLLALSIAANPIAGPHPGPEAAALAGPGPNPIAEPIPNPGPGPDALAGPGPGPESEPEAEPEPEPESFPPSQLFKRADKTCRVYTGDGNVACRTGAGTGYSVKYRVSASYRFGVRCKANGSNVMGNRVWDWIPGWGCWISAYYTRPADGTRSCETGVPWC